jgi:hypothetical protein
MAICCVALIGAAILPANLIARTGGAFWPAALVECGLHEKHGFVLAPDKRLRTRCGHNSHSKKLPRGRPSSY